MPLYNFTLIGVFVITPALLSTYLNGNTAPGAVVVHEDTQHVWDELRKVELELSA